LDQAIYPEVVSR